MAYILAIAQSSAAASDTIIIDSNVNNVDLKTLWELSFPPAGNGDTVNFIVANGVEVGSSTHNNPAMTNTGWAAGVIVNLTNQGDVFGAGGDGGQQAPGDNGGTAIFSDFPINIDNTSGTFAGGGGGGGGSNNVNVPPVYTAGGGGGAGIVPGVGRPTSPSGQNDGQDGTKLFGGAGGDHLSDPNQPPGNIGGDGGDIGQAGSSSGDGNSGGGAGLYADGDATINWVATGTRLGGVNP